MNSGLLTLAHGVWISYFPPLGYSILTPLFQAPSSGRAMLYSVQRIFSLLYVAPLHPHNSPLGIIREVKSQLRIISLESSLRWEMGNPCGGVFKVQCEASGPMVCIQIPAPQLLECVTLGKLLCLSEPQLPNSNKIGCYCKTSQL